MKRLQTTWLAPVLLIVLPSALAFLLLAQKLGFYTDDWYSIYAVASRGVQVFWQIFSFDRPARAYLMIPLYNWLGAIAPLYSFSGYAVRLIGALVFAWLLDKLWPGRRWVAALAGLFYLIYPGFLDQPKAFDYQSHLWSVSVGLISIALSVRAQLPGLKSWQRAGLLLASMPLTLFYLSQMEYFIGLEGLRFLLIGWVELRALGRRIGPGVKRAVLGWLAAAAPLVLFLVWRVVFFQGARSDTDLGKIFGQLGGSVLQPAWLGVHLLQDVFNTLFSAWVIPLYQLTMAMRLRDVLATGGVGLLAAGLVAGLVWWQLRGKEPGGTTSSPAISSMVWLGLAAALIALIPAELGGRRIEFIEQTRYSLPVSAGLGMAVAGLLAGLAGKWRIVFAAALLCGVATATHYANSQYHVDQWQSARDFWWQLSWRAPQIAPGTTLMAEYPNQGLALEYVTWGPANLIYSPQFVPAPGEPLALSAMVPAPNALQGLVMKSVTGSDEKGILTVKDAKRLLVLWMPETGCLKAMDGQNLEFSEEVNPAVYLAAPYSRLDLIEVKPGAGPAARVPDAIFGAEPPHAWCYYYQKASLARQRGDWAEVARLGDEALASGPDAADWVEFLPFIQAYANQGEFAKADNLARFVLFKPWLREQACRNFSRSSLPSVEGQKYLVDKFCH
jgi:hypothetical protein